MRTPRLPVVDWTDASADLNGLVRFAERRNLVSARVPSHFKWPLHFEDSSRNSVSWLKNVTDIFKSSSKWGVELAQSKQWLGYELDDRGHVIRFSSEAKGLFSAKSSRPFLGPPASYSMGTSVLSSRRKTTGGEADHFPPSSVQLDNLGGGGLASTSDWCDCNFESGQGHWWVLYFIR